MSLKNISLRIKLLAGFFLVSSLVFVIGLIGINASKQIVVLFQDVVRNDFERYNALLAIRNDTNEVINQTLIIALQEAESDVAISSHNDQKDAILAKVEKVNQNIDKYAEKIEEGQKENVVRLTNLSDMTDTVIDDSFQLISLREQNTSASAILVAQERLIQNQELLRTEINTIVQEELQTIEDEDRVLEATVNQTVTNVFIVSLMTLIIAIAVSFLFSLPLVGKVRKLRNVVSEVAKGNLEMRVNDTSHDELGELGKAFDQMTQQLKEVNEQKQRSAEELQKKSEELFAKATETERINKFMVDREQKMIELKKKVAELEKKLG